MTRSTKWVKGFTLVEVLVVVAITGFLVGGGLSAYTNFSERQTVRAAEAQLENDLRFVQGKAASNDKPEGCGTEVLEGFELRFTCSYGYEINALCGGGSVNVLSRNIPASVILAYGSDVSVKFYILGKGAEAKTFKIWGFDRVHQIQVTPGGEIISDGEVNDPGGPKGLVDC